VLVAIHDYLHNVGPRYVRPLTSAPPSSTSALQLAVVSSSPRKPFPAGVRRPLKTPRRGPTGHFPGAGRSNEEFTPRSLALMQRCFIAAHSGPPEGDPYYFYAVITTRRNDTRGAVLGLGLEWRKPLRRGARACARISDGTEIY